MIMILVIVLARFLYVTMTRKLNDEENGCKKATL